MAKEHDYYLESTPVPETPSPGGAPETVGQNPGHRQGPAEGRRIRTGERAGRLPFGRLPAGHALWGNPALPPPPCNGKERRYGAAEKMDGVRAVISASTSGTDVLWPYSRDQRIKLFDPRCRYEGEVVAAVAADTPYRAWDAVRAIKVDYDVAALCG